MKFGTIRLDGEAQLVMQTNDGGICPMEAVMAVSGRDLPGTMLDLVTRADDDADLLPTLAAAIDGMAEDRIIRPDDDTDWLPPIGNPSKILGVAFNNRELMKKAHHDPGVPNFFLKPPSCLTGHGKPIFVDPDWGAVIPEPEICAVIGRRAKHIS